MNGFWNDIRFGLRMFRVEPAFAFLAVAVLAIGTGATTAVFSLVETLLLRPLPVRHPDRLIRLYETEGTANGGFSTSNVSPKIYLAWKRSHPLLGDLAAGTFLSANLTGIDAPQFVGVGTVTPNFFDVIGVAPTLGRSFAPGEDHSGSHVLILSHSLWIERFAGDPHVLGRKLRLNGVPYTVIGVMPPHFRHPYYVEAWIPIVLTDPARMEQRFLYVSARMRAGVTRQQLTASIDSFTKRLTAETRGAHRISGAIVADLQEGLAQRVRSKMIALLSAGCLVLIVACVNLSNLFLGYLYRRRHEFAVRRCLGSSAWRLMQQSMLQAGCIAVMGSLAGVSVAGWAVELLVAISPIGALGSMREFDYRMRLDMPMMLFACALAGVVTILLGVLPAWRSSRVESGQALRGAGRGVVSTRSGRRLGGVLIGVETALTFVLIAATGVMVGSFRNLSRQPRGISTDHRVEFQITLAAPRYGDEQRYTNVVRSALDRLQQVPGIVAAAATSVDPFEGQREFASFSVEGKPAPDPPGYYYAFDRRITPSFFKAQGIPLLYGRDFSSADRMDSPETVIINNSMARRFWPGESALGKRIKGGRSDSARPWMTVVGVVGDIAESQDADLGEVRQSWYRPFYQQPALEDSALTFVVKYRGAPEQAIRAARQIFMSIDPDLVLHHVATSSQLAGDTLATERLSAELVALFSTVGLLLAGIGLAGVTSIAVAERNVEMGLRIALGAPASAPLVLLLRENAAWVATGLASGWVASLAIPTLLGHVFANVPKNGGFTLTVAALLLFGVAVMSTYIPARRTLHLDPGEILRSQ